MITYQEMIGQIAEMHTYCRPHGSPADLAFCDRFIAPIPGARKDDHGNWIVVRGDSSPVLFSSHTDTVHHSQGMQTTTYDDQYVLSLSKRSRKHSACLGADDTAGVFLMLQLIERGIPGTYVFHYGEERGGIGSSALARYDADFLKQFQYAIAFDRAGFGDVITHQGFRRTASDSFAQALADKLNLTNGFEYKPSDGGIYTDTAEYADDIPECTNISVGYLAAHSSRETLDCVHLLTLLEALSVIDYAALPVDRDPSAFDFDAYDNRRSGLWSFEKYEPLTTPISDSYVRAWDRDLPDDQHLDDQDVSTAVDASLYLNADYAEVQDTLRRLEEDMQTRNGRRAFIADRWRY